MNHAIEYSHPPEAPPPQRMQYFDFWSEWRVPYDFLRLGLASPDLLRLPRGNQEPVILIPGWQAPEASMAPLRLFLRSRGYDAHHWGFGTNQGNPERDTERLAVKVSKLVRQKKTSVALIGWSLGGVIARETARLVSQEVSTVVTYGTPAIGGPTYTLGARSWGRQECERITQRVRELDERSPISIPIAAVFTRRDEVVSWPACIDRVSPRVKHFEVGSTHFSMGIDPAVWRVVVRQLQTMVGASLGKEI